MRAALAFLSVAVLALHAVVFHDQFFARWQEHQEKYFDEASKRSDDEAVRAALANRRPAVEQIIVRKLGAERVDRCTTCHIAVEDPRFASDAHPLRTHPPVAGHRFESFGCTICHDGQGRAVEADGAHTGGHDWPWPILPSELIEANCVQCHTEPGFAGAPKVAAGRALFFERACYTCHTIRGLSYGSIGPELTDVGHRRRFEFLRGKIENPRASNPTSTMPRQELTPEQVTALVAFLEAQRGGKVASAPLGEYRASLAARPQWLEIERIVGPEVASQLGGKSPAQRGEVLLPRVGCLSCHRQGERDGRVGPDLDWAGKQRPEPWLMDHFKDPKAVVPGSLMPPYPLPNEIFADLSAWLLARPLPAIPEGPAERYQALCARCHGDEGRGDGVIAPYLDPRPRDLTDAAFLESKPVDRLVASVTNGVAGTSMAPWGGVLGDEGTKALVDWVLATFPQGEATVPTGRTIPAANPVPMSDESVARGEAIFLDRCWGCHGKKADGHGPNAEDIVPRPRNLRNAPFVASVSDARLHESIKFGVSGTAMPATGFDFALDDQSIGDLVNWIRKINERPAPPAAPPATASPAPAN